MNLVGGRLSSPFSKRLVAVCPAGSVYSRHIGVLIYVIGIAGGDRQINFEKSEYEIIVVD